MSGRLRILVTGASGALASTACHMLSKEYDLVGVDPRPFKGGPKDTPKNTPKNKKDEFPGIFHQIDYRQRKMADIFRNHSFYALLHLGRIPVTSGERKSTRFHHNVLGTRSLLELALKYSVKNVIVCSTFHVYGAHQHNHLYITEDDPLRASQMFPELADAVELDNVSSMFMLKNPIIRTVILRPCNIVGPLIQNDISKVLRSRFVPVAMGYDPMEQFVHEIDFANAMKLALEGQKSGIYNVAGEGVVPWTKAIELAGATAISIPHAIAYPALGALRRMGSKFPKHLLDYFRFPTVISDELFRSEFKYSPQISTLETLQSVRPKGSA